MRARANPHTRLVSLGSAGLVPVGLPVCEYLLLCLRMSASATPPRPTQHLQRRLRRTSAPSGRGSAYCNSAKASGCDGVRGGTSASVSGCGSACSSSYSIKKGRAEASATHLTEHLL